MNVTKVWVVLGAVVAMGCRDADNRRASQIHYYAGAGNAEKVASLLRTEPGLVHEVNNSHDQRTPLHAAARSGKTATIEVLLEGGATVDAGDFLGMTALHDATVQGHLAAVRLLIDQGANIEAEDRSGNRALFFAALHGRVRIVELLLDSGAYVNSRNGNRKTPLHVAAKFGHRGVVDLLLKRGADANAKDRGGKTPRDSAKNDEVIELLQ